MIKRVSANKSSFKNVEFSPGFNVVWADRTKESTKKDSRNGLGKSTLIEIIHFCLGANARKNKGLLVEQLSGWEFSLEMQYGNSKIITTRSIDSPRYITLYQPPFPHIEKSHTLNDLNLQFGDLLFGIQSPMEDIKYLPTFRSLISYFIRRGKDAFSIPFEHYRKQREWDKQVNNAFLLGLAWEDASKTQLLKDHKTGLDNFKKAVSSGIVKGFVGTLGDLEAQKIRLKEQVRKDSLNLKSFKVHPQYEQIQKDANRLTEEIHDLVNKNTQEKRLLEHYDKNIQEENPPDDELVSKIYSEAGIVLPDVTLNHIDSVLNFHKSIIENRKNFLTSEINKLKKRIVNREHLIESKSNERASLLEIMNTHGALEEYTLLQSQHLKIINELKSVMNMIDNLQSLETRMSQLKIDQQYLQQEARRDYDERQLIRERAVTLFNEYSEKLYNAPGKLVLDIDTTGFKFDVDIERSGSAGISNMKVFCYDMMLARLWAERTPSPRLLIHDSTIFDGVDERQRALALEIAATDSEKYGFQYICTLNSDYIPWKEFSNQFDLKKFIKVTLTDQDEDGCLLGIRF